MAYYYNVNYNDSPATKDEKVSYAYHTVKDARAEIYKMLTMANGPTMANLYTFGKRSVYSRVLIGKAESSAFGPDTKHKVMFAENNRKYVIFTNISDYGRNRYFLNKDGSLGKKI